MHLLHASAALYRIHFSPGPMSRRASGRLLLLLLPRGRGVGAVEGFNGDVHCCLCCCSCCCRRRGLSGDETAGEYVAVIVFLSFVEWSLFLRIRFVLVVSPPFFLVVPWSVLVNASLLFSCAKISFFLFPCPALALECILFCPLLSNAVGKAMGRFFSLFGFPSSFG